MANLSITKSNTKKAPRFVSDDKALESALNSLADSIDAKAIPDMHLPDGSVSWEQSNVTLRMPKIPKPDDRIAPWTPLVGFDAITFASSVTFMIGTINQVVPSNYSTPIPILQSDVKFILLTVTTSNGVVTGAELSLSDTSPATDAVSEGAPPTEFVVVLGLMKELKSYMIVTECLQFVATEVFREAQAPPSPGMEPFKRWYRWSLTNNLYTLY